MSPDCRSDVGCDGQFFDRISGLVERGQGPGQIFRRFRQNLQVRNGAKGVESFSAEPETLKPVARQVLERGDLRRAVRSRH